MHVFVGYMNISGHCACVYMCAYIQGRAIVFSNFFVMILILDNLKGKQIVGVLTISLEYGLQIRRITGLDLKKYIYTHF